MEAAAVAPAPLRDAAARLAAAEPAARAAAAEAERVAAAAAALHAHAVAAKPRPPPPPAVHMAAAEALGEELFVVPKDAAASDVVEVLQMARNNAVGSLQRLRGIRDAAAREADAAAMQLKAIDHALRRAAADASYYRTVEKLARDAAAPRE